MKTFLVVLLPLLTVYVNSIDYEGHKVYHVFPRNERETTILKQFQEIWNCDVWKGNFAPDFITDVMISPILQNEFEQILFNNNIKFNVMLDNVGRLLKEEYKTEPQEASGRIHFDDYFRFNDIQGYLKDLAKKYPTLVTLETAGRSTEGRELVVLKLSSGGNGKRPVIFVDGGIHAREWISPAVVLYILNQLIEGNKDNDLYAKVDWYILPVINPDGYEYSHVTNRMWRKTRSVGTKCNGTDANRNFDHHWGEIGTSSDECSETYKGKKAFSEPEALAVANFVNKYASRIKINLSFHSYGQYLLFPWGYTSTLPPNYYDFKTLGENVRDAIYAVNGTKYTVGTKHSALYPTSGTSVDWVYGVPNVTMSYTIELPGYDYGFVLPPRFIKPIVNETYEGVKVFAKYIANKYG